MYELLYTLVNDHKLLYDKRYLVKKSKLVIFKINVRINILHVEYFKYMLTFICTKKKS
jgi:hypothetical protein